MHSFFPHWSAKLFHNFCFITFLSLISSMQLF
ncbi:UNVERIFIED_CONTAM: hypothetical protein NCL1_46214 [Trichonephila clavipes]